MIEGPPAPTVSEAEAAAALEALRRWQAAVAPPWDVWSSSDVRSRAAEAPVGGPSAGGGAPTPAIIAAPLEAGASGLFLALSRPADAGAEESGGGAGEEGLLGGLAATLGGLSLREAGEEEEEEEGTDGEGPPGASSSGGAGPAAFPTNVWLHYQIW